MLREHLEKLLKLMYEENIEVINEILSIFSSYNEEEQIKIFHAFIQRYQDMTENNKYLVQSMADVNGEFDKEVNQLEIETLNFNF